jgi:type IV secretory pathway TraG/TraD family ATPase VirD4
MPDVLQVLAALSSFWSEWREPFLVPATYLLTQTFFWRAPPPLSGYGLAAALVFSWWVWATAFRLAVWIPARIFGLGAPEYFRFFLWLSPPWRLFYRAVSHFFWWRRQDRSGTTAAASWESKAGILTRYLYSGGRGIPFGVFVWRGIRLWQPLAYGGNLGINIFGKTGQGKSATFTTWLGSLHRSQSALFVDCDGEIVRTVGDHLIRGGHALAVFDPNGLVSGRFPAARWNVFDEIDGVARRKGRSAIVQAFKALGEAVVTQENPHQPTFDNGGRDFFVALCVFVWLKYDGSQRTLGHVRHILCCGIPGRTPKENPFDVLLFEMEETLHQDDGCNGHLSALIARGASTLKTGNNKDGGNPFLGSAKRATSWLDIPSLADACSASDVLMADLKTGNPCVAIVAPVTDIRTTYRPWVRMIVSMLGYTFENMPRGRQYPAAVIVDEAQNLGPLRIVESGPFMRKYELQLVTGIQDLPGLKACYPETWQTIMSNAGMNIFLPTTDAATLGFISSQLGIRTCEEEVPGTPWYLRLILPRSMHIPTRVNLTDRPLKNPQQVRDTLMPGRGRMIVLSDGRPFIAGLNPYWKALPVRRYETPKGYGEPLPRSLTRLAVNGWRAFRAWIALWGQALSEAGEMALKAAGRELRGAGEGHLAATFCTFLGFCGLAGVLEASWPSAPEDWIPPILALLIGLAMFTGGGFAFVTAPVQMAADRRAGKTEGRHLFSWGMLAVAGSMAIIASALYGAASVIGWLIPNGGIAALALIIPCVLLGFALFIGAAGLAAGVLLYRLALRFLPDAWIDPSTPPMAPDPWA